MNNSKFIGTLKSPVVTKEIMYAVLEACDRALAKLVESQPFYQTATLRDRGRMQPSLKVASLRLDSFYFVFFLDDPDKNPGRALGVFFPESHTHSRAELLFGDRHRDAIAGVLKPALAKLDVWESLVYEETATGSSRNIIAEGG